MQYKNIIFIQDHASGEDNIDPPRLDRKGVNNADYALYNHISNYEVDAPKDLGFYKSQDKQHDLEKNMVLYVGEEEEKFEPEFTFKETK